MWWNRNPGIFWGGILVVLGVLFLLGNTGVLANLNWDVIWPVTIIALGVWLLVARIGQGGSGAGAVSAEPIEGLSRARLEISVGAARLDVRSAPLGDQLYRLSLDHVGATPEVRFDRATGTLRVSTPGWFPGMRRLRLEAHVSDAIPWDVSCSTGAIRGEFDFTSGQLASIECKTGASQIGVRLPAAKGRVPVRFEGGVLTVDVARPVASELRVQVSAGAVQLRVDGGRQEGIGTREWRSNGFDAAADRYELTVSGGTANVRLEGS